MSTAIALTTPQHLGPHERTDTTLPKSLQFIRSIELARAELNQSRATQSELEDLERVDARRQAEQTLQHRLRLLGALVFDAYRAGASHVAGLLAELVGEPDHAPTTAATPAAVILNTTAPTAAAAGTAEPPASTGTLQVTPDLLARLNQHVRANIGQSAASSPGVTPVNDVGDVNLIASQPDFDTTRHGRAMRAIGELLGGLPSNLRGRRPAEAEMNRLERVVDETLGHWSTFGAPMNHALTSLVTVRARSLQNEVARYLRDKATRADLDARIDILFGTLTSHSAKTQPGNVNGLARKHTAPGGSWVLEAIRADKRVSALAPDWRDPSPSDERTVAATVSPANTEDPNNAIRVLNADLECGLESGEFVGRLHALLATSGLSERDPRIVGIARRHRHLLGDANFADFGLSDLERAVRAADKPEPDDDDNHTASCVHRDWTKGKHAVIVGGDRRQERLEAMQKAFGFATINWLPTDQGSRHVEALENRIRNGSVDVVFVLQRFVSHAISDKMFDLKTSGCRIVLAESYGIQSLCRGLDRFIAASDVA